MALDQLLAALERDARSEARSRLERARRDAAAMVAEAEERAARERTLRLAAVEAELRDRARARLVTARRAALRRTLEARRRMFDRVLTEAARRLAGALRSEAFLAALPALVAEALTYLGDEPSIVSCPAAIAADVETCVGSRPGLTVRAGGVAGAGVRIEATDESVVIEGTLETRLAQLRPLLQIAILRALEDET